MANVLQNGIDGFSLSKIMPITPARNRHHSQKQPITPKPKQQQQQQWQQRKHQQQQQQQLYSAKKQQQKPQQQQRQQQQKPSQQQKVALNKNKKQPHQPMQPQQPMQQHKQQQQQQKQQQQQQQQHTPIKGNNSKLGQRPTYSQVAKSGNNNSSINKPQVEQQKASGPASRHLSAFQNKLRAEQAQKKQQQEQQQQQQIGQQLGQQHDLQLDQQPPTDDCLSLAIMQNTHTIALMGEKMDAMLDIIRDMLSRLLPVSPQQTQQQQHIEPIIRIASPNPNDMSVDTIVFAESSSQSKLANDNGNE
ncbi:hypothetical protein ACLKA6_000727 [Drosophila palustris]